MTLHGKVAIVTGGNTGIGRAVVLSLAGEGADIVIDYIANEVRRARSRRRPGPGRQGRRVSRPT